MLFLISLLPKLDLSNAFNCAPALWIGCLKAFGVGIAYRPPTHPLLAMRTMKSSAKEVQLIFLANLGA